MKWWDYLALWSVVALCLGTIGYHMKISEDTRRDIHKYEEKLELYHNEYLQQFSNIQEEVEESVKTCNDAVKHCDYIVDVVLNNKW